LRRRVLRRLPREHRSAGAGRDGAARRRGDGAVRLALSAAGRRDRGGGRGSGRQPRLSDRAPRRARPGGALRIEDRVDAEAARAVRRLFRALRRPNRLHRTLRDGAAGLRRRARGHQRPALADVSGLQRPRRDRLVERGRIGGLLACVQLGYARALDRTHRSYRRGVRSYHRRHRLPARATDTGTMITLASGISYFDLNFLHVPGIIATAALHRPGGVALIDPGPPSTLPALRAALPAAGSQVSAARPSLLLTMQLSRT